MRKWIRGQAGMPVLLACFWISLGLAQQGHPLSGTWSGDWGPSPTQRNTITFVMNWDGKNVTGLINPGPDSIPIASVYLDVSNWSLRVEADTKDQAGKPVHIVAEGKMEDIGSYHRTIKGSWQQGAVKGDFRLTRE